MSGTFSCTGPRYFPDKPCPPFPMASKPDSHMSKGRGSVQLIQFEFSTHRGSYHTCPAKTTQPMPQCKWSLNTRRDMRVSLTWCVQSKSTRAEQDFLPKSCRRTNHTKQLWRPACALPCLGHMLSLLPPETHPGHSLEGQAFSLQGSQLWRPSISL